MMAAASPRMLNVDPLMRTRLGGASVAGTWTPFPTPLVPNKIAYSRKGHGLRHSFVSLPPSASFVAGTVATSFRFRCGCASPRYANTRLLVYKHTHHVYTHRA